MGAGSGASTGAGIGTFFGGPVGTAVGAGLGALGGWLFGRRGDDDDEKDKTAADAELNTLRNSSTAMRQRGDTLNAMGTEAVNPVLQYFSALLKGDPNALLQATQPERARVIDQYDTARQAISQFSPRGGGTNAALAQSRFGQASTLANITATARSAAAGQAGQIGTALTGLGLNAQQLASADLNTIINAILTREGFATQERGQNLGAVGGIGEGIGSLIGLWLTRGQGGGNA